MSMDEEALEQSVVARSLRDAFKATPPETTDVDISDLLERVHNDLALREVMGLGFVHMLRSVLTVLTTVFKLAHAPREFGSAEQDRD